MNKPRRFLLRVILPGALVLLMIVAGGYAAGFRYNFSQSMPVGIWRVVSGKPQRGDYVLVNIPDTPIFQTAHARGYIRAGFAANGLAPLIKRLAAVEGDVVAVGETVTINAQEWPKSHVYERDPDGRALPRAESGTVQAGFVWVLSDYNAGSFDSRYFGPLPVSAIQAKVQPVWIW